MRAKLFTNRLRIGAKARDYVRLVKGAPRRPMQEMENPSRRQAEGILETIRDQNQPEELDVNIEGKVLIDQMDHDLEYFGQVPYWYSDLARSRGEAIGPGVRVILVGDTSRQDYCTVEVSFDQESVRIRDLKGQEFILPWNLVIPAERDETTDRPYWFTSVARARGENLEIGDYVRVGGQPRKYELTNIFWEYGDVEVREIGSLEYRGMPWTHIRPWGEEDPE